jgi:DNA-3-methyladenine glycosylase
VLSVARDCIGKLLVHRLRERCLVGRIVEAEAYRGPEDRAAHSFGGRRTPRTEVMFGPPGHAYMFLIYGLHWNFNIVTGRPGQPHAVLIRAVEPVEGGRWMAQQRKLAAHRKELTNGPGKLCQAFALGQRHYGLDLCVGPLFLADAPRAEVARSRRIGIDYAGSWAEKQWRFYDPRSQYTSKHPKRTIT